MANPIVLAHFRCLYHQLGWVSVTETGLSAMSHVWYQLPTMQRNVIRDYMTSLQGNLGYKRSKTFRQKNARQLTSMQLGMTMAHHVESHPVNLVFVFGLVMTERTVSVWTVVHATQTLHTPMYLQRPTHSCNQQTISGVMNARLPSNTWMSWAPTIPCPKRQLFIHSFINSFIHLFIHFHSFIHSLTHKKAHIKHVCSTTWEQWKASICCTWTRTIKRQRQTLKQRIHWECLKPGQSHCTYLRREQGINNWSSHF